jgi:hypothetical protein
MSTDNQETQVMKPYPINRSTFRVQDEFSDDDVKFILTAEYKRLDSSNFRILLKKEEDTKRIQETLTKNRTRDKLEVDEAHENFFNSLVSKGWIKRGDDPEEEWTYQQMLDLNVEQKIALNVKFLDAKAKVKKVLGSGKYDFLLKKDGYMLVELFIGDPEHPIWILLLKLKRPPQGRRSQYRDSFAYGETNRAGDLPITQTKIDLSTGVRFFDEHFETVVKDSNYSPVHFLKDGVDELDHEYVEGNDEDKKLFIQYLNSEFKVDVAGEMVKKFSKSGREL